MIYEGTIVKVGDNSGALEGRCIRILSPASFHGRRCGDVGSIILLSVTKVLSNSKIKRGDLLKGLVVRTTRWNKGKIRQKFFENSVVIVKWSVKEGIMPIGSRIKSPVSESIKRDPSGSLNKVLSIIE